MQLSEETSTGVRLGVVSIFSVSVVVQSTGG